MAGFKDFADGAYFTASEVDGYLMRQTVMQFATTADLLSNLVSGIRTVGMLAYAADTAVIYMYQGSGVWMPMASQWQNFTPVWQGPTTLSIGNGTLTCRWRYSGGVVFAHYELVRGSTTNGGSAAYTFTLPVQCTSTNGALGSGICRDASPFTEFVFTVIPIATTAVALMGNSSNARYTNNVPIATLATGDAYYFTIEYEPHSSAGIS